MRCRPRSRRRSRSPRSSRRSASSTISEPERRSLSVSCNFLRRVVRMTFEAYETVVEDSGYEARGRERQALSLGIDRLERLQKEDYSREDQVQSLLYVRRLWTIFIEDLTHPENGLP